MTLRCLMATAAVILAVTGATAAQRVEIKDGWFYVDGEKFFVKGMDYFELHMADGKMVHNSPEMIDRDFRLMKEAGFNTVKSFLLPEEIKIAKKHGLMVANIACPSCFNEDYKNETALKYFEAQISSDVAFGKEFDNVLYYWLDNEPSIFPIFYGRQEKSMEKVWRGWVNQVKGIQPGAYTTLQMMPPSAWADTTMADVASLNLYPFNPADAIGYSAYLNWYKRKWAADRPLVVSEYGWVNNINDFSPAMMNLLDEQLKAGAQGSYLFIWRAFGREKESDNYWWGVMPNEGKTDDWKLDPRPIYQDYKKYFEAVAVEPRRDGMYGGKLPFEIYGTENTGSMTASAAGKTVKLSKSGRFWWKGEIPFGPESYGHQTVSVEAKDHHGVLLVKKEIPVLLAAEKKVLRMRISRITKDLTPGGDYSAKITVMDERGRVAPNVPLKLDFNQSSEDPWVSEAFSAATDAGGTYEFSKKDIGEGYLALIAGVDPAYKEAESLAGVDMARVEAPESGSQNPVLNRMAYAGLWKTSADNGSKINLSKAIFGDGSRGIEVSFDLGSGRWVAMDEVLKRDLSKYKGIRFNMKEENFKDRLEVKVIDADGSTFLRIFQPNAPASGWYAVEVPFSDLKYGWGGDQRLDLSGAMISFAVSREGDVSNGPGKITIGQVEAMK